MKSAKGFLCIPHGLMFFGALAAIFLVFVSRAISENLIWVVPIAVMVISSIRFLVKEAAGEKMENEE